MMCNNKIIVLLICFCVTVCGCGRKQKNIFNFDVPVRKPSTLLFPVVRGGEAVKTQKGDRVSWLPIDRTMVNDYVWCGYNVYPLVCPRIIPKKPYNKEPIKATTLFVPRSYNQALFYAVRSVFSNGVQVVEGPVGLVISVNP
ncbi:MAG: hypothetical protein US69_C0022G0011 [candidate division TM6 bacterium GW2011_GWF2_38_10]|nr:MAG: hypothetical protein US69_C0022G0011 [candidate division TM6 bacterium GW2011_GWF2_38_10]